MISLQLITYSSARSSGGRGDGTSCEGSVKLPVRRTPDIINHLLKLAWTVLISVDKLHRGQRGGISNKNIAHLDWLDIDNSGNEFPCTHRNWENDVTALWYCYCESRSSSGEFNSSFPDLQGGQKAPVEVLTTHKEGADERQSICLGSFQGSGSSMTNLSKELRLADHAEQGGKRDQERPNAIRRFGLVRFP